MMTRLRDALSGLRFSLRGLFERRGGEPLPVIRGGMRRVLVLRPCGSIFQEAVFILRDDYFQTPGVSRRELLREAKRAAEGYVDENLGGRPSPLSALLFFALGAASAVLALWVAGLIALA